MQHQGGYRCRPTRGRFKIMLPGTGKAPSMSAAGRVVLYMLSIFMPASMMSSEPGMKLPGPREQASQESHVSNPPASAASSPIVEPTVEPTVVTIAERPMVHSIPFGQPAVPSGSEAIARELQKELKRVGCYAGQLNGGWTRSTREAMKAFADRVNAKLPMVKPDGILLALVQGHSDKVCGVPCPFGQSLISHTERCTPDALLARSGKTKVTAGSAAGFGQGPWTVKTIAAAGEASGQEDVHPADIGPAKPPTRSAGSHERAQRGARRHWQPAPKHEGSWASNFFRQRDRFGFN